MPDIDQLRKINAYLSEGLDLRERQRGEDNDAYLRFRDAAIAEVVAGLESEGIVVENDDGDLRNGTVTVTVAGVTGRAENGIYPALRDWQRKAIDVRKALEVIRQAAG